MNTPDHTKKEISKHQTEHHSPASHHEKPQPTAMQSHHDIFFSAISYLGPLVILSLLVDPENRFIRFHIHQGLALFSLEIVIFVLRALFGFTILYSIVHFIILVLAVAGIINVVQEKEKNLPLIGFLAKYFLIFT